MKFIYTDDINECIVEHSMENFDIMPANESEQKIIFGSDVSEEVKKENGISLIDNCGYCFRISKKGKLIPYRMTMHPKTCANYMKGAAKYAPEIY